jgi:hypothetical protein
MPQDTQVLLAKVQELAEGFAFEIAQLACSGGDATTRSREHNTELAEWAVREEVADGQVGPVFAHYKTCYLDAMALETAARVPALDASQQIVEKNWVKFMALGAAGQEAAARDCILNFQERCQEVAQGLPTAEQQRAFLARIEKVRNLLADEYDRNPGKLRARLGLEAAQSPIPEPAIRRTAGSRAATIAADTLVRATVWETVRSIFRAFR